MADTYTEFTDTDSLDLGDSEGYIVMEGSAEGFVYRKRVLHHYVANGQPEQILTGIWHIQILDGPDGAVLFEQIITNRYLAVSGVTVIPLDGGGKFQTMIVNGEPVSRDADGNYEGWKYVDLPFVDPDVEFATPIFSPNTGIVAGSIFIDVDWLGPRYKLDLQEGAVLKVVQDEWRDGTDIPIDFYKTSIKPGVSQVDAIVDPYSYMWHVSTKDNSLKVQTGLPPYRDLELVSAIPGAREGSIQMDRQGQLWILAKEGDGWWEYTSLDGRTFTQYRQLWDKTANMARMIIADDGTHISLALDGNNLLMQRIPTTGEDPGDVGAIRIATVTKRQPFTPVMDAQGNIYAVGEDGAQFSTLYGDALWTI